MPVNPLTSFHTSVTSTEPGGWLLNSMDVTVSPWHAPAATATRCARAVAWGASSAESKAMAPRERTLKGAQGPSRAVLANWRSFPGEGPTDNAFRSDCVQPCRDDAESRDRD